MLTSFPRNDSRDMPTADKVISVRLEVIETLVACTGRGSVHPTDLGRDSDEGGTWAKRSRCLAHFGRGRGRVVRSGGPFRNCGACRSPSPLQSMQISTVACMRHAIPSAPSPCVWDLRRSPHGNHALPWPKDVLEAASYGLAHRRAACAPPHRRPCVPPGRIPGLRRNDATSARRAPPRGARRR